MQLSSRMQEYYVRKRRGRAELSNAWLLAEQHRYLVQFEPLKDPEFFSQLNVDEFGAIYWPNNADLAPDALYRIVTNQESV